VTGAAETSTVRVATIESSLKTGGVGSGHRGLCRRRKVLEEESKKAGKMENGGVG
jgi:hypothetical protein